MESVSPAERERFLAARGNDPQAAQEMLEAHLAWRAATLPLREGQPRIGKTIPEWMFFHGTTRDGTSILWINGARYDAEAATEEEQGHAAAALIDERVARDSPEQITVCLDVRGSEGWPNPPAYNMLSAIRTISGVLSDNFPERCCRVIVYPMPWGAATLWTGIKLFLDQNTADKVVLLSGPVTRGSPCPVELAEYVLVDQIRPDMLHRYESLRTAAS